MAIENFATKIKLNISLERDAMGDDEYNSLAKRGSNLTKAEDTTWVPHPFRFSATHSQFGLTQHSLHRYFGG